MARPYWCTQEETDGEVVRRRAVAPRQGVAISNRLLLGDDQPEQWGPGGIEEVAASCSDHAGWRRAQRHLRLDQVDYVLVHGAPVCRTGAVFHVLRRCDIAPDDRCRAAIARLEGTVVLVEDGIVITVYRNRHSYHQIQKKAKYARRQAGRDDRRGGPTPAARWPPAVKEAAA
jgi:hypothetical protein